MKNVRTVKICDPSEQAPYPSFAHNTTTYVSIPHDRPSQLFVQWDKPCRICVSSGGQEILCNPAPDGQASFALSQIQPPAQPSNPVSDLLQAFKRNKDHDCHKRRLYAFSVVIQSAVAPHAVLATYDYHILCPAEFEQARICHVELQRQPGAIAPDLISDRAEGTVCPHCKRIRASESK